MSVDPIPDEHTSYDPYAWFDPEVGRTERRMLTVHAFGVMLRDGMSAPKMADYLESLCGVRNFSHVKLEDLPLVLRAISMLRRQPKRTQSSTPA